MTEAPVSSSAGLLPPAAVSPLSAGPAIVQQLPHLGEQSLLGERLRQKARLHSFAAELLQPITRMVRQDRHGQAGVLAAKPAGEFESVSTIAF